MGSILSILEFKNYYQINLNGKIMKPVLYPFLGIFLIISSSCHAHGRVPAFDAARAFAYLEKQCDFGPRNPGSRGHRECMLFLEAELKRSAETVTLQPFLFTDSRSRQTFTLHNIIANFGQQANRILLCAHWDTRPWADAEPDPAKHDTPILGANDGASGVAVLLEIARILHEHSPPVGIDIVLFDGEDSGLSGRNDTWCQGSRYFARNKRRDYLPVYGILLDFVGDRDLRFPIERFSYHYAPDVVDRVWSKAEALGLTAFDRALGLEVIDDHLELLNVGIPTINIIDFDYPYYHTLQDTPDKCSPESLGVVGTLLVNLIYE